MAMSFENAALYENVDNDYQSRWGNMKKFNSLCPEQYATKSADVYLVEVIFVGHDNRLFIDHAMVY
jgi:hypothetical protein